MYLKRRLVKFKGAYKNFFPRLQFSRLQAQRLFLSYPYYNSPEHPCRFRFNMKIYLKRRLVEFKGAYKHFFLRLQFSRLQTQRPFFLSYRILFLLFSLREFLFLTRFLCLSRSIIIVMPRLLVISDKADGRKYSPVSRCGTGSYLCNT